MNECLFYISRVKFASEKEKEGRIASRELMDRLSGA